MNKKKNHSWEPMRDQIMTRWANEIDFEKPLPEYPRPHLRREEWVNLNGLWDYAICPKEEIFVESFEGKILVPFPLESALSGVKKPLKPEQKLWYHRKFFVPESWKGKKILLHFGAVDWEAKIWINNKFIGFHKGGYTPFYFEISNFIQKSSENDLIVSVWDPTDKGHQELGKQSLNPKFILYTAVSGIWQTVWFEPVSKTYIKNLKMIPNIDNKTIKLQVDISNAKSNDLIDAYILEKDGKIIANQKTTTHEILFEVESPKLWSPKSPYLYDIIVEIKRKDILVDKIKSYFGMRKISLSKNLKGVRRIELNNQPLFQYGTLDQGYWPDGLYTAPTDNALKFDINLTKELGFNLIRKHVKIEPARWYYHCDKIGILVWQDMPNGEPWSIIKHIKMKLTSKKRYKGKRKDTVKQDFYNELESMINLIYNSPSVVVWTPFNEGWGQFDTEMVVKRIKELDSSRLINNASGWFDKGVGDIRDIHNYPNPKMPKKIQGRATVLGEFGGLGLEIKGHTWNFKRKFVYRKVQDQQDFLNRYNRLLLKLKRLIEKGLSAAVYTQITDIEHEINGLLTYDREILKMDKNRLYELNLSLYDN
ncbi:MAG: glycoside hydrolase family 2 protein [Candidatus Thorarchaeota archaeon]